MKVLPHHFCQRSTPVPISKLTRSNVKLRERERERERREAREERKTRGYKLFMFLNMFRVGSQDLS